MNKGYINMVGILQRMERLVRYIICKGAAFLNDAFESRMCPKAYKKLVKCHFFAA